MEGFALGQPYGYGATEQTTVDGAAPAAGQSFSFTFNGYDRGRLVFCTFDLSTDANVANRYVTVEYQGSDGIARAADAAAVRVAASTTNQRYCGSLNRGTSEWATGTDVLFPLCGLWLEAGATVKINVAGIQAGDTLTNIRLTFDRWLDGSQRPQAGGGSGYPEV